MRYTRKRHSCTATSPSSRILPGPTLPVPILPFSQLTCSSSDLHCFTSSPSSLPAPVSSQACLAWSPHLSPGSSLSLSSSSSSLRKLKLSRACSTVMLRLEARLRVRPCLCWDYKGGQSYLPLATIPELPQPSPAQPSFLTMSRLSSRVTSCSRPCSSGNWPR